MIEPGIREVPREKRSGPSIPERKNRIFVKFFLDKPDRRGYSRRFISGGPAPEGETISPSIPL